jgi:hypothetical protein
MRRVSAEQGRSIQRLLQVADLRYQAISTSTHAAATAALRGAHVEAVGESLRAVWPRVVSVALACTILGGVLAVPAACLFALLTGLTHASAPLRTVTPQVFGLAVLWFMGAIIGAHFQPRRAD